jgi:UPF0755 protein
MFFTKKNIVGLCVLALVAMMIGTFFFSLESLNNDKSDQILFQVTTGNGVWHISQALQSDHLIRSAIAFELFALLDGRAGDLKTGLYRLSPSMDTPSIISALSGGNTSVATVTIPEGDNIYDIDRILSNASVISPGELINLASSTSLEGKLFPDTYEFNINTSISDVVQKMSNDFNAKAQPLLAIDPQNEEKNLIIASILEKEVPDQADQEIVAGIILKRLELGIPLDIDATVCYAKFMAHPTSTAQACSLTTVDFNIDSPYNTYIFKGLPPGPIGNPGLSAITAALHPASSSYLYYLSDPKTGKTIFAKTLDEQNQNRIKYLDSN